MDSTFFVLDFGWTPRLKIIDPDGIRLLSPISYRLRNPTPNFTSGKSKIPRIRIGGAPLDRAVVLFTDRQTFVGGNVAIIDIISATLNMSMMMMLMIMMMMN